MSVVIAIPTISGSVRSECLLSTLAATRALALRGTAYEVIVLADCPVLPVARNTLVAMFMQTNMDDLFFIDSDVGFDAAGLLAILDRPEKVVAGVYPLKRPEGGWPAQIQIRDGVPIGRDGLIEADYLPSGFMRIKRVVFERMQEAYPALRYQSSVVTVNGAEVTDAYDFFNMGCRDGQTWRTEDYAFCQRWRDIGGQLWVYPDIDFSHIGIRAYHGNYHHFLRRQPGGSESPWSGV